MLIRVIVWPTEAQQHLQEPMASPRPRTPTLPPAFWAFTRCHYFIVSLHACDRAVQLTLCCSGQASRTPAHRPRRLLRRGVWVWDSPFPGQASLPAHLDLLHRALPLLHCLLMHSTTSQHASVCSHCQFKRVIARFHSAASIYMGMFCFSQEKTKCIHNGVISPYLGWCLVVIGFSPTP